MQCDRTLWLFKCILKHTVNVLHNFRRAFSSSLSVETFLPSEYNFVFLSLSRRLLKLEASFLVSRQLRKQDPLSSATKWRTMKTPISIAGVSKLYILSRLIAKQMRKDLKRRRAVFLIRLDGGEDYSVANFVFSARILLWLRRQKWTPSFACASRSF